MCYTAKASITAWWILAILALFLWYRNEAYDRAISIFVFTLGVIQLIEYGVHSGADAQQSGQAIYITLWLQCLVLAIGVFIFIKSSMDAETDTPTLSENIIAIIAGWNLLLFAVVFIVALVVAFATDTTFSSAPGPSGHIEWHKDGGTILGGWSWLYVVGLFGPLILIFAYLAWADVGIALLILYGILSAAYIFANYPPEAFTSMWCYLAIGFAFLAWMVGIIPGRACTSCEES